MEPSIRTSAPSCRSADDPGISASHALLSPERLAELARELAPGTVARRRDFHRWPELSFQEVRTAGIVAGELRALGLEVQTGLARTGVMGTLRGGKPGPTLLVRADMDALPVDERNGHDFVSQVPGVMHACGHDAHAAMLLAAARILAGQREQLPGNVRFVFQPAEEGPGGAELMIEAGCLDHPTVDAVIGFHIWADLPIGIIGVRSGPLMASSDEVRLTITGRGGHGADPHLSVDAMLVAAHVLVGMQAIVSREIDPLIPAVITFGKAESGRGHNIIAHEAILSGTVRTFDEAVRKTMPQRIERLAEGIASAYGATCKIQYSPQYPVTVCDRQMCELVRRAARSVVKAEDVVEAEPTMGSEDIAYFLQERPGCYFLLGAANPDKGIDKPHHHPEFDIDEDALPIGVQIIVRSVLDFLAPSF